jgi:outer membrane lipase/esterase
VIDSIFNQIAISERGRNAGTFNTWVSGDVSALSMNSGYPGFPNDPGVPLSGTVGADYALAGGWLVGGAMSVGTTQQSFSLGGNFKFNEFAASFYAANTTGPFWADLVGTIGGGHYDTDRIVPIGITSQQISGRPTAVMCRLPPRRATSSSPGPLRTDRSPASRCSA